MSNIKHIGIIGWNSFTEALARTYHYETRDTEILAIASSTPEAQIFAREVLGLKHVFTDPHPLYELHQLDLICIQSSPENHLDEVKKSLASGVKIMIEQPLAGNVEDCLEIEKATRSRSSQKTLLLMPRRFDPELIEIKNVLSKGSIGDIVSISIINNEAYKSKIGSGALAPSLGIFMDVTYQDIDTVRWFTGQEFTSVYARGSAKKHPELTNQNDADTAHISCELEDKTLVHFTSCRASSMPDGFEIKIKGTEGELTYSSVQSSVNLSSQNAVSIDIGNKEKENYLRGLKYMGSNINNSDKLPYDLSIGTAATKVAVAMTKSFVLNQVEQIS